MRYIDDPVTLRGHLKYGAAPCKVPLSPKEQT